MRQRLFPRGTRGAPTAQWHPHAFLAGTESKEHLAAYEFEQPQHNLQAAPLPSEVPVQNAWLAFLAGGLVLGGLAIALSRQERVVEREVRRNPEFGPGQPSPVVVVAPGPVTSTCPPATQQQQYMPLPMPASTSPATPGKKRRRRHLRRTTQARGDDGKYLTAGTRRAYVEGKKR